MHQAQRLCELIEQQGGHAVPFPVLEIVPRIDQEFLQLIQHLSEFHLALFISPNAVNLALPAIKALGGLPANLQIGAVGKATAAALATFGCSVDLVPTDSFDSESLLALTALQTVQNKNIIIFRGEGGRELLANTLRDRGATVQYAECYQRVKPSTDPQLLLTLWAQHKLDIIIVTSMEGFANLSDMVGSMGRDALMSTPLLMVSNRMAEEARRLGVKSSIVIAAKPGDQDVLETLVCWARQQRLAKQQQLQQQ